MDSVEVPRPRPRHGLGLVPYAAFLLAVAACRTPPRSHAPPPAAAEAADLEPEAADTEEPEELGEPGGLPRTRGDEEGPPEAGEPRLVSGSLTSRYRGRWSGGDSDHDLYETLNLELGEVEGPGETRIRGHLAGQVAGDLDGGDARGEFAFYSLQDTYDDRVTARLFHAYADVLGLERLETLRIGRQFLFGTPLVLYFDGVHAETTPRGDHRVRLGAYGGLPTHPYESSSRGDALLGLHASLRPWEGAELRCDWMHLDDETRLGKHRDDLYGLSLSQDVRPRDESWDARVEARATALEDQERDASIRVSGYDADHGVGLELSYYELFDTQRELATPLDPFFNALFELFPYRRLGVSASKSWDELLLQGGAEARRVEDDGDVGQFNRDFERYHLSATLGEPLPAGLSLALTGEVWESAGNDVRTWGLDLSRELDERWRASLGTYYSLFKYDLYLNEERDDVRTYYVDLRRRGTRARTPSAPLSGGLSLRYEFESTDPEDFHRLSMSYTWHF